MNVAQRVFLPSIICVAALSFATGRLVTNADRDPVAEQPVTALPDEATPDVGAAVSVPEQVPNILGLPFVETYRILKFATPETVRSYYRQLDQLPRGPRRNAPLNAFFKTLIQANPSIAKDLILELKKNDRWLPLSAIQESAPPHGMETVAEVLLSFDRGEISGCSYDRLRDSLDEWGKNDPMALKQFLESHRHQDVEQYFGTLVRNWAACDPEAAQQWMAEEIRKHPVPPLVPQDDGSFLVEDSDWRSTVEQMAVEWVQGFLANDPDAAVSYILEQSDNKEVQSAMFWLAGDLFTMSPERARNFILQLSEEQQSVSLRSVANKVDLLVRSDANDNTTSPRYVAEWIMQFPPKAWKEGIGMVLRSWEFTNPRELFAWMSDLPSQTRETVVQEFPSRVSADDAQKDFDSIMQADDLVLRGQLLEKLMHGAKDARAAMLEVLERAPLSPAQRSHLASLIPVQD